MAEILSIIAIVVIMVTSLILFINQRWRFSILILAVQFLAVFWLVGLIWSFGLAAVKLVVGWMVCAVLGSAQPSYEIMRDEFSQSSGIIFRVLAAILVWLLAFSLAPIVVKLIPTGMVVIWGGLLLIGMGLLQLGITNRPPRIILGLITLMSGFEILYAAVEDSILVAGLLTLVNLGLALAGTYFITSPDMEEPA
jgi:hypothetical protein